MPKPGYQICTLRQSILLLYTDYCGQRSFRPYCLESVQHYGRLMLRIVDGKTGMPAFPGQYYDEIGEYRHGYVLVQRRDRRFHIDNRGRIAYRWRFADCGPVTTEGVVRVQHPRAYGWSRFHIPTARFITNPPRYTR